VAAKPASFWSHLFAPLVPRVVERVIREASCGVFLTTTRKWFNREAHWGRPVCETGVPLDSPDRTLENETPPVFITKDAQASRHAEHSAAA
jgi:hypothetical protein